MSPIKNTIISGNARVVRNVNRAVILNMIREMQPITRVKIAKLTGLNKSTVSSIVSDLLNEDLISQEEDKDKNVGRNPINLRLKLGKHFVGAINIDSATARFAITDIDGSMLGKSKIDAAHDNPELFIKKCLTELFTLRDKLSINSLEGIGVSISGIVDQKSEKVIVAPHLGWEDFEIGRIMKNICADETKIVVNNDAKASALAELWFGRHDINLANFVFLSIGPGIGTGIVIEKKLMDGAFHAAGEFGHMTIFEGGEFCFCGNHGCWEAYASDRATTKRYIIRKYKNANMQNNILLKDIIKFANNGDSTAKEILTQTGHYIGLGIANIIKVLDPEAVIIGGGIIKAYDLIYPEIMQTVARRAFFGKKRDVKILPTSLSIRPRLLGAATLAIREIFEDLRITR